MTQSARDLLVRKMLPNNPVQAIRNLRVDLSATDNRDMTVDRIDQLAFELGEFRAGRFITGIGEPDDGTYSGVLIDGEGIEFPASSGDFWNVAGFDAGTLEFGLSAMDGKAYFAGGAATIDASGITVTGDLFTYTHTATSSGITRRSEFGMTIPSGHALVEPVWRFESDESANLITTNEGFELGDFTGWTQGGGAKISVSTTRAHTGTYSYRIDVNPTASDYITRSIPVVPLTDYTLSWWHYREGALLNSRIEISWYDSGAVLVGTDASNGTSTTGAWDQRTYATSSPANAASVTLKIWYQTSGNNVLYIDDISLTADAISREVYFGPDFTVPDGPVVFGGITFPDHVPPSGFINIYYDSDDRQFKQQRDDNNTATFKHGSLGPAKTQSNSTSPIGSTWSVRTPYGFGATGYCKGTITELYHNNTAGGQTVTTTYTFGSYTFGYTTGSLGQSATSKYPIEMEVKTWSNQADNAQIHFIKVFPPATAQATATLSNKTPQTAWDSSSVDTSPALSFDISLTANMNSATPTQRLDMISDLEGPNYAA